MAAVSYPKIPGKAWRVLRDRVSSAPSTKLTPGAVAALLSFKDATSARDNVLRGMRRAGLVDEEGLLTDRGRKWRLDASYREACDEILQEVYPDELLSLVNSDGSVDTNAVKNWFGHQGLGTSNAGGMASTFIMIAKKELPERGGDDSKRTSAERKGTKRKAPEPKEVSASVDDSVESGVDSRSGAREDISSRRGADIHLDIQIHIPANASAEQIDQIFASMSKHLYDR